MKKLTVPRTRRCEVTSPMRGQQPVGCDLRWSLASVPPTPADRDGRRDTALSFRRPRRSSERGEVADPSNLVTPSEYARLRTDPSILPRSQVRPPFGSRRALGDPASHCVVAEETPRTGSAMSLGLGAQGRARHCPCASDGMGGRGRVGNRTAPRPVQEFPKKGDDRTSGSHRSRRNAAILNPSPKYPAVSAAPHVFVEAPI